MTRSLWTVLKIIIIAVEIFEHFKMIMGMMGNDGFERTIIRILIHYTL